MVLTARREGATAVSGVGPPPGFALRSLNLGRFGARVSVGWPPPRLSAHAGGLDISRVLPSSTAWESERVLFR